VAPKLALDRAAERGDLLLRKFERENRAGWSPACRCAPRRPQARAEIEISRNFFILFGYTRASSGAKTGDPIRPRTRGEPMRIKVLAAALAAAGLVSTNAQAQTEIQWWHSMGRRAGRGAQRPRQQVQ